MRSILFVPFITLALAGAAHAAPGDPDGASERTLRQFQQCRQVSEPAARLRCFETAADDFEAALKRRDVRIVDREEVRQTRRSLFGFSLPKIGLFERDPGVSEEQEELDATVREVRQVSYGKLEMVLDGGAVWTNIDPVQRTPKPGSAIHLKRGTMGNYYLKPQNGRGFRGIRIR